MSKVTNKNKLIAKMMEDILSMNSDTLEFSKFGKVWVFRQLTTAEHLETITNSRNDDMIARIYKMQIETLKQALVSIDGVEFSKDDASTLFNSVVPTIGDALFLEYDKFRSEKNSELEKLDSAEPEQEEPEASEGTKAE